MTRRQKLTKLFDIAPPFEPDFRIPSRPSRFVALELDADLRTLGVYLGDDLGGLGRRIAASETQFVEYVRVHDLDADIVMVPFWRIDRFETLEDEFSYDNGYVTIT